MLLFFVVVLFCITLSYLFIYSFFLRGGGGGGGLMQTGTCNDVHLLKPLME